MERAYDGPTELVAPAPVEPSHLPAPTPVEPPRPPAPTDDERPGPARVPANQKTAELARVSPRFVVAPTVGIALGLPRLALLELSLFLGASLPTRARRGNFVALGVQGVYGVYSLLRGHVAVHGVAGPNGGLVYQVGAGPVGIRNDDESIVGGEFEGRIGYVFTQRPQARVRGTFGLLLRLGRTTSRHFANEYRDERVFKQTAVQGGLFVGFTRAPVARGTADHRPAPPRGVGLLIPGILLLTGFVGSALFDVITFSTNDSGECHGCVPITVYALPALAAGLPLTIVGGLRLVRYREWRRRVTLVPRATGLALHF